MTRLVHCTCIVVVSDLFAACSGPATPPSSLPPTAATQAPSLLPSHDASEPEPLVSSSKEASAPPDIPDFVPIAHSEPPKRVDGMILVPEGSFTMGADQGGEPDEWPAHTVTLPAFYLDEHEVTNEEWALCVTAKVCPLPEPSNADRNGVGPDKRFRGPRQPVSSVSWFSARDYCAFVGKRLPTEAEFEKASRGTDGRTYPWGNDGPGPSRAVFAQSVTADVGTHPEGDGPYGHHDLAGNVWEWTDSVYDPFAYRREGADTSHSSTCEEALRAYRELRRKNKQGFTGSNAIPTECERVLRGGGFNYHALGLRTTNRVHHPPRYRMVMSGLRCARDVAAPSADVSGFAPPTSSP